MNRTVAFAGSWYPTTKKEIEKFINLDVPTKKALGAMCPHAGWVYSGRCAGMVYSRMKPVGLYVIIGPNHSGLGAPVSIYFQGEWDTPLGPLTVDNIFAKEILTRCGLAVSDTLAHKQEHSIEVQLPFIKRFSPVAKILPISLGDYNPLTCQKLGLAIAGALKAQHKETDSLVIASSDMSHYLPAAAAEAADKPALERILNLDPAGLLHVVSRNNISMCGSGPVAVMLHAAIALGARSAELVNYTNSGASSGDYTQVVSYAGITIS